MEKTTFTATFSTKAPQWDQAITLTVTFDYDGVSNDQVLEWATTQRKIALQSTLRDMTEEAINEAFPGNKGHVHVLTCGQKIQTKSEVLATLRSLMKQHDITSEDDLLDLIGS